MESNSNLPSGEWNGFYIESQQDKRGWMHLYMTFEDGAIKGEGTDYVGPWVASGKYDLDSAVCHWVKQYLNKHQVVYSGQISKNGIQGQWEIGFLSGPFHIWPKSMGHFNELYMREDLTEPGPTVLLQTMVESGIS